jgi:eukaryotic-like serine/threonine-protein kinase
MRESGGFRMNSERWQRVKQLLDEALLVEMSDRASFVDRACAGDAQLRQEVDSLLASHERAGTDFLKVPAADLTAIGSDLPREGRRIGAYQIIERIGHGGMGEVYRAVRADGQYKKDVAVKLVRGGYDTNSVLERFRNERQILASLDHPNIARLLDGGTTDDGVPYLVMELIEGKPIDQYCDQQKLSVSDRLRLFRQVCAGVHYAHQRLVIHRDIKPSNVLVTKQGEPKLLDFGIAKIVAPINEAETTLTRAMTPEYASPEQIRGEPITTATDVYSLGVVLYQLLTGRSPYSADTRTPHKLAQAVCDTEPGRPSTVVGKRDPADGGGQATDPDRISSAREGSPAKLRRRLAGDLDDITMMALRKEPARRYGSVEQFAEDIRHHLEGLPVAARKGSWSYRAEKFARRHRVGIAAATIVILAVAGGVGATIREARIARANARRAENRFNDVRHLANSLIFDVDKSIADLPGSTPARKLLADDALQYLDTLAREAKGDLTLQRELATAYQKLGEIQGNPHLPNLGETSAAQESYSKSLAIRQALAAANPGNKADQLALAFAYEWLGNMSLLASGNLEEALADETNARSILEPLAQSDPDNFDVLDKLRGVYGTIGDIEGGNGSSANLGDVESALENHRKALAIAERIFHAKSKGASARLTLAISHSNVAGDLVKKGDRSAALVSNQNALDILQSLAESSPTYKRSVGIMYQRIGNLQMMDGDSAAAIKNYRARLEITERLAENDPKNAAARLDLADSYSFIGLADAELGDPNQGLAILQKAIDLFEKETTRDPKLSFARRMMGLAYLFQGEVLLKSGKLDGALSDFRKMASIHELIASVNSNDANARIQLAAADSKVADVLVARGESNSAIETYQKALAVVEPLAHSAHPLMQAQYTAADTYSGLGAALQKQAFQSGMPIKQQNEALKQACSWFDQSLAEWRRVPNPGKFSPDGFDTAGPSHVVQELSSCEAQLAKQRKLTEVAQH